MAPPITKRTTTMNWDDLACDSDEDTDEFYESNNRISAVAPIDFRLPSSAGYRPPNPSGVPIDLLLSDDDDDDDDFEFEDTRMSFTVHPLRNPSISLGPGPTPTSLNQPPPSMENYGVWMAAPGSIKERRKRLLQGMGINSNKDLSRLVTMRFSKKYSQKDRPPPGRIPSSVVPPASAAPPKPEKRKVIDPIPEETPSPGSMKTSPTAHDEHIAVNRVISSSYNGGVNVTSSPPTVSSSTKSTDEIVLFRSRSDGDMASDSFHVKSRREEMIGVNVSKQHLTRSASTLAPLSKMCRLQVNSIRVHRRDIDGGEFVLPESSWTGSSTSDKKLEAFFLIKNLDTGKEFVVKEFDEDGMWNRLSDIQTGKQLTMDEFEKTVGYSPIVKELMRRHNGGRVHGLERKMSSAITKSFRYSKKRGASLLKNIKSSVSSGFNAETSIDQHQKDQQHKGLPPVPPPTKGIASSEWVKVRQQGKTYKELTALRLCQEIQAHEGSIWSMKFNASGTHLASAGEDKVIHIWEVQEIEIATLMPQDDGEATDPKKGKSQAAGMPDYVQLPDTVFGLSERPLCSFTGHLDDVLDLSWSTSQLQLLSSSMDKTVRLWDVVSKACLKLFAHNDYVTCIDFNPVDDNMFISGSLDTKIRIWSVIGRRVVDWVDFHEMVTAACYSPDGQSAIIGSHKGNCRVYSTTEGKLNQLSQFSLPIKNKKVSKITGFEFTPETPSEVLITSADSRIRIYEGEDIIHKFVGYQNLNSQIAASYSPCGRHVISASEDSHVFVWKRDEHKQAGANVAKTKIAVDTRAYEQFECKDVSVAIPWPGCSKFESPNVSLNPKKGKPAAAASGSPSTDAAAPKKPPLPKKPNHAGGEEKAAEQQDEIEGREETEKEKETAEVDGGDANSHGDTPAAAAAKTSVASAPAWTPGWGWLDGGGNQASDNVQATAWGMVIVTAGLSGEIKAYQNIGLPVRIGKQKSLFS